MKKIQYAALLILVALAGCARGPATTVNPPRQLTPEARAILAKLAVSGAITTLDVRIARLTGDRLEVAKTARAILAEAQTQLAPVTAIDAGNAAFIRGVMDKILSGGRNLLNDPMFLRLDGPTRAEIGALINLSLDDAAAISALIPAQ